MYQSGTEPALMLPGWYGPNSHTGLICAAAPSSDQRGAGERQQRVDPPDADRPRPAAAVAEQEQRSKHYGQHRRCAPSRRAG